MTRRNALPVILRITGVSGRTRPRPVLERRGVQPQHLAVQVDCGPRQLRDHAAPPAGVVREVEHVAGAQSSSVA